MGLRTVNASVCVHDFVFYSHFALSYLSLKISEDHCDFPADYTLQLFNTFEDKWVCHVSHHMVFFSPLWKGHLTINTVIWQLNIKQWIRCLLINWVILCTRACYTAAVFPAVIHLFCWLLVLQQWFPCFQRSLLKIFPGFYFFALYSHNTKTTTWLDPRLAKKAKPPEKCEDGGMYTPLLSWFSEAYTHSIKYCTCFYTRAYLHCICPTLHEPSLLTLSHNESSNQPGWNMNVWLLFEMAHHLRVTLSIAVLKANFSKI